MEFLGQGPILEQLQHFATASLIVAPHGAGLANMVVSPLHTPVLEIGPPGCSICYLHLAIKVKNLRSWDISICCLHLAIEVKNLGWAKMATVIRRYCYADCVGNSAPLYWIASVYWFASVYIHWSYGLANKVVSRQRTRVLDIRPPGSSICYLCLAHQGQRLGVGCPKCYLCLAIKEMLKV